MVQSASAQHTSGNTKLDKATALAIGFGLHNAWVCAVMYAARSPFDDAFAFVGINGSTVTPFYIISAIAFGLTALFAAFFDQRLLKLARSRSFVLVSALITCLGTLALLVPVNDIVTSAALEIFVGIATGIGSACLAIVWGVSFAREKASVIALSGSIAYALGYILNTLVIQAIPAPASQILVGLIPLAEFAILVAIIPSPIVNKNDYLPFNALPTSKSKMVVRLFVPLVLIGFALGVLKALSVQNLLGSPISPELFTLLFLASSLSIALFALYPRLNTGLNWDTFLRVVVPCIACLALVGSLLMQATPLFSNLFLLIAYLLIESLMWIAYAYVAHTCRLSPIYTVGMSRCLITFSLLAGVLAPAFAERALSSALVSDTMLVWVALACIALGYILMPKEKDLLQMVVSCPAVRMISLELDENMGILGALKQAGETGLQAQNTPANAELGASGSVPASASHAGFEGADAGVGSAEAGDASAAPAMSEARAAMLGVDTTKHEGGKFSHKVKKVANTFLLTERETDILFELAKGNSPKYIESKYYISAGTVKTHIRNIYHKLDVHKRDELIRLIEHIDD